LWRLAGEIDAHAVGQAVVDVEARHTALRSRFGVVRGCAVQIVEAPGRFPVAYRDLRSSRPSRRWRQIAGATKADLTTARVLTEGVGCRTTLWRVGAAEYVLTVVGSHTAWDGGSIPVFLRDFVASYAARRAGFTTRGHRALQPWDVSALDAEGARSLAAAAWISRLEAFRQRSLGSPAGAAPAPKRPRGLVLDTEPLIVSRPLRTRLEETARREGARLSALVVASIWLVLRFWGGSRDQVLGICDHGRNHPAKKDIVACVMGVVPLVLEPPACDTVGGLVRSASQVLRSFRAHDITMAGLFPQARGEGPWSGRPICDVTLNYRPVPSLANAEEVGGGCRARFLSCEAVGLPNVAAWQAGALEFEVVDTDGGGLAIWTHYDANAVAASTAMASVRALLATLRLAPTRMTWRSHEMLAELERLEPAARHNLGCTSRTEPDQPLGTGRHDLPLRKPALVPGFTRQSAQRR
jgi:hypothetical protein